MLVFVGANGAGFISLQLFISEVSVKMNHLIVNFVARLYDLHSDIAVLNLGVNNALYVTTLDFIERYNLIVLVIIIFE